MRRRRRVLVRLLVFAEPEHFLEDVAVVIAGELISERLRVSAHVRAGALRRCAVKKRCGKAVGWAGAVSDEACGAVDAEGFDTVRRGESLHV